MYSTKHLLWVRNLELQNRVTVERVSVVKCYAKTSPSRSMVSLLDVPLAPVKHIILYIWQDANYAIQTTDTLDVLQED